MNTVLTFDFRNETGIEIVENDDKTFSVIWGDYVANCWEESFPSLSLALVWVSALVECGEAYDWDRGFKFGGDDYKAEFISHARTFFGGVIGGSASA
jgi:hypothetical protein